MNTDEIAAKELKGRKDFSLSASIGGEGRAFAAPKRLRPRRRGEVSNLDAQQSALNTQLSSTADGRRWTQMKIAAKELEARKDFTLSAGTGRAP